MRKHRQYYSDNACKLVAEWESVSPEIVHQAWRSMIPYTKGLVLDIGAGSGRDAAWLAGMGHEVVAVEPCDTLRAAAQSTHVHSHILWVADKLPVLQHVRKMDCKFDIILLSAVWMHVPHSQRADTFRRLVEMLKPGGKLVFTLRKGPAPEAQGILDVSAEELIHHARKNALETVLQQEQEDSLQRTGVNWSTLLFRLPDDRTGALPLLRHIVVNDAKSATYKMALLRTLLRIADGGQGAVLKRTEDFVTIPFGLVALYWLRQFVPLLKRGRETGGFMQLPQGNSKLEFAKSSFWQVADRLSPYDLRVGNRFEGELAETLTHALRAVRNNIKKMPATKITWPGGYGTVFECNSPRVLPRPLLELSPKGLEQFGTFSVPTAVWDSFSAYSVWIEPAILEEWCRLMAGNDGRNHDAGSKATDAYRSSLIWLEPERATAFVRGVAEKLHSSGRRLYCVWSGARLRSGYHIDHCLPFAHWPNNDLWNLFPCSSTVNLTKSDRLPSAELLMQAKDRMLEWWHEAYCHEELLERFRLEAGFALPGLPQNAPDIVPENVHAGIQAQRMRLKVDQQLQEWDGRKDAGVSRT